VLYFDFNESIYLQYLIGVGGDELLAEMLLVGGQMGEEEDVVVEVLLGYFVGGGEARCR